VTLAAWLAWFGVISVFIGLDIKNATNGSYLRKYFGSSNGVSGWQRTAEIIGPSIATFFPIINIQHLDLKLTWAGRPFNLTPEGFIGLKVLLLASGMVGSLFLIIIGFPVIIIPILVIVGYILPDMLLDKTIEKRQNDIHKTLPDMIGLLATALKAGVELNPALKTVSDNMVEVLGDEMRLTWREIATGRPKAAALKGLAKRTGLPIMERFIETIVTSDELGGMNLSQSISTFRIDLIASQSRRAQENARKIPTKMLLPIFLCIFLPLIIILLTPIGIIMVENF
jgi:tight adherence protein C